MIAYLVDTKNKYLSHLYMKLTLMKNFVKTIDGKKYLKETFLTISDAKLKEGIFVGLQIRELKKDENFE